MARLTTFSRLLITLAIVAAVFFGVRYFFPNLMNSGGTDVGNPVTNEQPATSGSDQTAGTSESCGKSGSKFTPVPFNYTAPALTGGKLKGVVELGATGFNSFIIKIDNQKNWELQKSGFGASLVYEKLATDDDIKSGLKRYINEMLSFGVGPKDIHFVISSGAKKVEITNKISGQLKSMGYYVNEVTPQEEAKYALKAAQPRSFQGNSFVVDIGSGNTKIAWMNGGSVATIEASGAKYFQNNQSDASVYQEVLDKAKQIPAAQRERCFIIGGAPYELARQHRSSDKERFTVLKAPGDYTPDGAKQKSGLNIYQAIADATGCKQFVFDWDANFTIGFLLNL